MRIKTRTERQAQAYQSQGGYPNGQLVSKTHSLFDTFVPTSGATEYALFTNPAGTTKFTSNGSGSIPAGQSMLVYGISVELDQVDYADANQAGIFNAFYALLRNSLWKFAKTNEDWSAYFKGGKLLPPVTGVTAAAGNRVGDAVKSGFIFKFDVPTVLGQNNTFDFTIQLPAALGAANKLVVAGSKITVNLDGLITKKQAT